MTNANDLSTDLSIELALARQQLHAAQARVQLLEAQLHPAADAPLGRAVYDYYVLDHLLEGCQIIDFAWRYCYLNDSAACHAQRAKETLLGYTMQECYPGVEKTAMFAMLQRCMGERTMANMDYEFIYPDGSAAWFELKAVPISAGLMIFSVNITARKQAEAAERESAEWARLALSASNLGKWQHNLETGLIRLDESARLHYGFAQETVTLDMVLKQLHPDDVPRLGAEIACALDPANDGRYATEYRVIHPDGSVHWLAIQAQVYFRGEGATRQPSLGIGTSQEISARKAAEEALKQYTQQLEILHQIDLGIISATSIAEIMTGALKQIRTLFACEQAGALLFDHTTNEVLILAVESTAPSLIQEGERYPLSPSFWTEFGTGQVSVIDDLTALPATSAAYRRVRQDGMGSSMRALLTHLGHPLGLLVLNAATPYYFTAEQKTVAAQIANQLAVALQQRQLVDDLAHYVTTVEEMQQFRQAILDGFPANIAVLDPDGVILTVNQRWKAFVEAGGATPDNYYLGMNYLAICDQAVGLHADDATAVAAGIRTVIAGEQDTFLLEYPCLTPGEYWFMLRVTPLTESAPRRVIVAHIDITERKAIEKAEHEQRLLAEALRDTLAVLTTSTDIETTMQQILDYSATVIPSEAGTILFYEGNLGRVAYLRGHAAEAEAFFRTNTIPLNSRLYPKGGEDQSYYLVVDTHREPSWRTFPVTAWVRSSLGVQIVVRGAPIGLLIVDSAKAGRFQPKDVAHLQTFARYVALALEKAQYVDHLADLVQVRTAELQAAKERVEAILHHSADSILLIDTDLRIHQANAAFQQLAGWAPTADADKTLRDVMATDQEVKAITQLIQTVIAEAKTGQIEFLGQRHNGAMFDAELSIGLVNDNSLVCILRDITERKAQERQLRYHASLQRVVGGAVIVTDMALQIQSWNQGAERIYGWRAADVLGQPTATILQTQFGAPEERAYYLTQLHNQGWWQAEVIQYHRDGHALHILSSVALIYDEHGNPNGVVAVNQDITERKLAEDALQKAAAEIFDLYNNAPCGYHSLDQNGVIVEINDTELGWLGYERAEVVGKRSLLDFLTSESQLIFQQNFPLFKARGWIEDLQYEFVCKNGATIPVLLSSKASYDEHGQFLLSHSSVFDITSLKQAQRALVESEARYRLLAENVKDVIGKLSFPNGIRTFITPSCYHLLGYTPDELIGQVALDLVHPDDREATLTAMRQALNRDRSSFEIVQRFRHKAGHYLWVEVTNSIVRDPETGTPLEIVGVVRDITERKRVEVLQEARAEEEHEFQGYLRALHEITIELTQLEEMDAFYRRTVELGLAYFKLDRLALFTFDANTGLACGVYGTDPHGNIVAEKHVQFTPAPDGLLNAAFVGAERFSFRENVPLFYNRQTVGHGWNVATVLWNGAERLGWLVADNLLTQKPATKPLLDILRLYALTVGTLLVQKQAQAALRLSEQRYRLLAENISDVVVETTPEAQFLYVSPSCQTVLGYEPMALFGQDALSYMHPDDLPLAEEALLASQDVKRPVVTVSVRFRHQVGHYLWLETVIRAIRNGKSGVIEKYIGSAREISDRKAAEVALKASEEKYRLLVETMRGGVAVYDVEDRFTYVNDRVCELFGYTPAELIGKRIYDVVDADYREVIKNRFDQRRQLKTTSIELSVNHRNGTPIHVLFLGSPLLNKNGDHDGSLVVIVDITAQKQAEDALRQALAKEKELSELKSRFVTMASHEFRTPLATILALTETLRVYRQKLSDDQIQQRLVRITEQIDHLKDIMEDVLLLAQMQARRAKFNPVATDLDALCRMVVEEFQSRSDIQHRLLYDASPGNYTIHLDPKLMHQILSNLVSNAIKYSPAEKPVQITLAQVANQCVLQVRDEGIGIPETDQKHLFEPFHRAGNVGTIAGTGLGLVITKEAVELHNGAITVESQVDQGTTFTICLPLVQSTL